MEGESSGLMLGAASCCLENLSLYRGTPTTPYHSASAFLLAWDEILGFWASLREGSEYINKETQFMCTIKFVA